LCRDVVAFSATPRRSPQSYKQTSPALKPPDHTREARGSGSERLRPGRDRALHDDLLVAGAGGKALELQPILGVGGCPHQSAPRGEQGVREHGRGSGVRVARRVTFGEDARAPQLPDSAGVEVDDPTREEVETGLGRPAGGVLARDVAIGHQHVIAGVGGDAADRGQGGLDAHLDVGRTVVGVHDVGETVVRGADRHHRSNRGGASTAAVLTVSDAGLCIVSARHRQNGDEREDQHSSHRDHGNFKLLLRGVHGISSLFMACSFLQKSSFE